MNQLQPGDERAPYVLAPDYTMQLLDLISDAVIIIDIEQRVTYWNPAAERYYGVSAAEMLGQPLSAGYTYLWESDEHEAQAWTSLATSGVWRGENVHMRRDGRTLSVESSVSLTNVDGHPTGMLAVIRDISARKAAEDELRAKEQQYRLLARQLAEKEALLRNRAAHLEALISERTVGLCASEERYRRIVETAQEGICLIDADDCISLVNNPMAEMFGYRIDELIGRPLVDVFDSASRADVMAMRERSRQGIVEQYDYTFRRRDGTTVEMLVSSNPIFDAEGHWAGGLAMVVNITKRKRAEIELNKSLHEKEVLLKELHHRVKNNLQIIVSLLRLQAQTVPDEAMRQLLRDSESRVYAMALVHEQVYQSHDLVHLDLAAYLQKLATKLIMAYGAAERVTVTMHNETPIRLTIAQAVPLSLAVTELISNSLKHAFGEQAQGTIVLTLVQQHNHHVLTLADDGRGLPATFDPYTSDSLGLQLVVNLVEKQLGGQIVFVPNHGTTVRISFPAQPSPAA